MDKKLEDKLFKKYKSIFQERKNSPKETCMCWGIATGNGWYQMIDNLCAFLMNIQKNHKELKIVASQVKQKWGTLRFYYKILGMPKLLKDETLEDRQQRMSKLVHYIDGAIDYCFYLSGSTCEDCGAPATIQTKGYVSNICEPCNKKRQEEFKKVLEKAKKDKRL